MPLKDLGEFGLIEKIKQCFTVPENFTGIGDDCSVIPQRDGVQTLVSTDMLVEGSHFLMNDIKAYDLGWKSAAVNFSDIAACGGKPVGSLLSLALTQEIDEEWIDEFIEGYRAMSQEANAPLLGGDTTSSADRICINVTVIGEVTNGKAKMRSNARPGDLVCVTGTVGDSAAGLKLILEGYPRIPSLIDKHYHPMPRLKEAELLSEIDGIHAMMDISDGIASDLRHILKASGVGAIINTSMLPMSDDFKKACVTYDWNPVEIALCGGEDYELLFTMSPDCNPPVPFSVIGAINDSGKLEWKPAENNDYMGYRHF